VAAFQPSYDKEATTAGIKLFKKKAGKPERMKNNGAFRNVFKWLVLFNEKSSMDIGARPRPGL
jgi:hypothetical protein